MLRVWTGISLFNCLNSMKIRKIGLSKISAYLSNY